MQSVKLSRLVVSVVAAVLLSFALLFVVLSKNSHAEYACETYSAGSYGAGNSGTGESCATDTSGDAGSGSNTGSGGGSTNSASSNTSSSSSKSTAKTNQTTTTDKSSSDTSSEPIDGAKSVTLNDYVAYTSGEGQELTMKVGDKAYFTVGSEAHTVTVKEITADYTIFTIASTPTDVKVPYGQTVNYDVDKDGTNDISLSYISLADTTATVKFAAIQTDESGASKPVSIQTTTPDSNTVATNYWWIFIPLVVIVAIAAYFIIRKKRSRAASQAGNFTPTSTTPPSNDSSQFHN